MTLNDLQNGLTRVGGVLMSLRQTISGQRHKSLLLKFATSAGGVVPQIECTFAAARLRSSRLCQTVMMLDETTLRVDGVSGRHLPRLLTASADLGALEWTLIA